MQAFLFFNIIISFLNIFLIVYAYSLNFFPITWRKKVNQDTLVGLALIFLTMFTGFLFGLFIFTTKYFLIHEKRFYFIALFSNSNLLKNYSMEC